MGESTVRKHLEHIYEKLRVRDRAAAARLVELNLGEPTIRASSACAL